MSTVTIKTSELTGIALDWAVAKCEEFKLSKIGPGNKTGVYRVDGESWYETRTVYAPSSEWAQGGPIIERERLCVMPWSGEWNCTTDSSKLHSHASHGPTPLIAAMRCYVASKLGDTVEIPSDLA
jgi:hypothetical protein